MSRLLLTNDDGIDSPALLPTYRALADLFDEVTIVVPAIERSWIGKAITRHGEIEVVEHDIDGVQVFTTSGYPADCTQLGVFHLAPERPDLVVSGINIGANHSTAFAAGSGTIGAAIEASLVGIDAVALSASSRRDNFPEWNSRMRKADSATAWEDLAHATRPIVASLRDEGLPANIDVLTVNIPETVDDDTAYRVTNLGETHYGSLFAERRPGVYEHDWRGAISANGDAELDGTDINVCLDEEAITITPIQIAGLSAATNDLRARFESPTSP